MARYESDITLFLKQLKKDQPELESGQLAGRDRLWDKAQDLRLQREFDDAQVAQKAYVYN
ncbi:MAG: DUF3460 family protein [Formosimonas sp.]